MLKKIFYLIIVLGVLSSCKSLSKTVTKSSLKPLKISEILAKQKAANINARTVIAKIKVKYITAKKTQNITAKLRLQKDSIIWISLTAVGGIPVAKILIKPHHVSYYEKMNKTYFDGGFSLLNKWLKTDLNFQKIQNMLFAQPIYSIEAKKFIRTITENNYQLKAKKKIDNTRPVYWIYPDNFKLHKQVFYKNKKEHLTFIYNSFDASTTNIYPNKMQVIAQSKKETVKINLTYRSLRFDLPLRFPFKIPKNYKLLDIK
jgi:Domain of unknown function (DUF4292)